MPSPAVVVGTGSEAAAAQQHELYPQIHDSGLRLPPPSSDLSVNPSSPGWKVEVSGLDGAAGGCELRRARRFGIPRCRLCAQRPPRKFQCANQQRRQSIAGWSPGTGGSHGDEPRTTSPLRAAAAAAAPQLSVMTCAQPTGVSRCSSLTRMLRRGALNEPRAACRGTQVHHRPPR